MACLFCEIVAGRIPSKQAYQDDQLLAFHDINPQAPTHVLVIPKRHVASLDAMVAEDAALLGALMLAAKQVAASAGLAGGYRVVTNCGADAGQSVSHMHLHVLGGRPMSWPPG